MDDVAVTTALADMLKSGDCNSWTTCMGDGARLETLPAYTPSCAPEYVHVCIT